MILIWTEIFKFIGKQGYGEDLETKPDLSFEYDSLHYDIYQPIAKKTIGEEETDLTDEECLSVETFCKNYDYLVYPILEDGTSGEAIRSSQCAGDYAPTPMIQDPPHYFNKELNKWVELYCVDDDGEYLGMLPYSQCTHIVPTMQLQVSYIWNFEKEKWEPKLEDYKKDLITSYTNLFAMARPESVIHEGYVYPATDDRAALLKSNINNNILSFEDEDGDEIDFENTDSMYALLIKIYEYIDNPKKENLQQIIEAINSKNSVEEIDNAIEGKEFEEIYNR